MPEDLLYLALIESGFSPRAYSRAHASGIWQFIEETGRRYGLRVSDYLDERRDPVKSTTAALDYLQELYGRFDSWYLAAAAYNTGENRVDRILRERVGGRRGDDALFWKIAPYLPQETRDYVPLMLAAGHIAKEPDKYGFSGLKYHDPLKFESILVPGGTALRAVARAAEVPLDEVNDLNPQLVLGVTPPGRDWSVRLPPGRSQVYAQNFERVLAEERLATIEHTVRRGETLSHIAQRYGTSISALQAANAGIRPQRILVGQRVRVPVRAHAAAAPAPASSPRNRWTRHQVRRGDSLWSISRRYGVSVRDLQAWNDMGRRSKIMVGQSLRIRG
jgi:membrane-bound lytic murein transglycosylase D